MKKLLGIVVLGLLWSSAALADNHRWKKSDIRISDYLKNGWSVTFVNAFKGWKNDETIYTLQKDQSIVSCKVINNRLEQCYEPGK